MDTPTDPDPDPDARLAALLAEMTDDRRRGRPVDVSAIAAAHPDLAGELRALWAATEFAEAMAADRSSTLTMDRSPNPDAKIPARIGDYAILDVLGQGGMGVVYRARHERLGRVVALKMLLRGAASSVEDRERFRHEVEAVVRLDHDRIVPVFEVGEHDGLPYFTMRLVDGEPLSKRLAEGPLPAREAATLLAPAARAIDAAHRQGVLHRDLKPSNLLIDRKGRPHVTDFGLAKRIDDGAQGLTRTGAAVGTPSYMAPEQADGRGEVGPRSDVYGLGAVLYQMLTGRPPFQAPSAFDVLMMVRDQDPLPPRLLNPKVDRALEMIALKCLQKPPDLRYGTAAALADDLEAYLEGRPIAARSGRFRDVASRLLGETHHAPVLENWGLLWMWHSLMLLLLCLVTNAIWLRGVRDFRPFLVLWSVGLLSWGSLFWGLRRRAGPITFVERQIAHLWAGSVGSAILLFLLERAMTLPVMTLAPILAISGGSSFVAKGGILSGKFYFQAAAMYATAFLMVAWPDYGITVFGLVSAACFFLPGLSYYRRRRSGRPA